MASVGEQLRAGRESRKLSVHQVAEITKIRTDHIRSLEEGEYEVFSAPVYIRGFVRTYATLLKLNVPAVMAVLDEELEASEKFSEPPAFTEERKSVFDFLAVILSRFDWRKAIILVALVALIAILFGAIAIIRHFQAVDPLDNLGDGMYRPPTNSISGDVLPLPVVTNAP